MEQSTIIAAFKTTLIANIWVERNNIIVLLMAGIAGIYMQFSFIKLFEMLLVFFTFTGIAFMGFVGIAAHIRYYFEFERNRKVELYTDRMVISVNDEVLEEVFINDLVKIVLHDKLRNYSYESDRYDHYYNFYPSFADSFYYLAVIGKNQERIILTCLLDIKLKRKIAAWYGQKLEHKYQFFPFPTYASGSDM
jgi:hypothetical protein